MFNFNTVLEEYSLKTFPDEFYVKKDKDNEEKRSIEVDVARSFHNDDLKSSILRKVLQKVLEEIPQEYIQGMNDIAAVIVEFYYGKVIDKMLKDEEGKEGKSKKKKSRDLKANGSGIERDIEDNDENTGEGEKNIKINKKESVTEKKSKDEKNLSFQSATSISEKTTNDYFNKLIQDNLSLYKKLVIILANIFQIKYLPMVKDEFQLYLKTNKVFLTMMEKRNIHLKPDESIVYMNYTLRWFTTCADKENIHQIFSIILTCPTSFSFLLLIHFFDNIKEGKMIQIKDNIMESLIELEREFLKTEFKLNQPEGVSQTTFVLLVGGLMIGGFAAAFMFLKRD
ncbi:hypothetical protein SLOPH_1802 [Spraguea lophii 42_110]|uniref:Rab-GAP TBC domain-containing protein n=1 Tax=Spraguea lophii (strain 42_110) TaxID=1358809 RepID=S7WAG7_SPRLO|nr:hypothetical protein SLOPH_1802 [Spraguea lophii 42_110]